MRYRGALALAGALLAAALVAATPSVARAGHPGGDRTLLVDGLQGGSGSTVGPDHALYVTETMTGRVLRVDPKSGNVTTFADGLPSQIGAIGLGGPMDVAFLGHTAYVLETLVGPDVGGSGHAGIYRIDGPHSSTLVADIGAWAIGHPPIGFPFFVPSGVQYAMQPYGNGFLVTDGHHNRVLNVSLNGQISEFKTFSDIVPTGLETRGDTVYMAEAGPIPHLPENGKIVSFKSNTAPTDVASGGRLLVDVEISHGDNLYALAQGYWNNTNPGTPAQPNTGQLLQANDDGSFSVVAQYLDRPTSLEFIGDDAYVITLTGQIWKLDHIKHVPDGA
jgi:hypothetical protein